MGIRALSDFNSLSRRVFSQPKGPFGVAVRDAFEVGGGVRRGLQETDCLR